jgi:epoxyqueuosine reductase
LLSKIDCVRLLSMSQEQFSFWFQKTSLKRTKRSGLLRNAAILLGNQGDESVLPVLKKASQDSDSVISEAAIWAMEQIQKRLSIAL